MRSLVQDLQDGASLACTWVQILRSAVKVRSSCKVELCRDERDGVMGRRGCGGASAPRKPYMSTHAGAAEDAHV